MRFRARAVAQAFGGASDFLEIVCPDGQTLRVRVPSGSSVEGEQRFEFDLRDAIAVRATGARASRWALHRLALRPLPLPPMTSRPRTPRGRRREVTAHCRGHTR